MQIAVISDLHLGPAGAADLFGHDDSDFLRFLGFLEKNFEKVVLLGDIWETLTGKVPGRPERELASARQSHPEIARRFASPRYSYIHGNHDLVAGVVENAPDELALEADGVRLLFTHGHQNDPIVRRARWASELGVWLGGWLRRFGLGSLYRLIGRMDSLRDGAQVDPGACPFQRWAVEVAKLKSADVVVTGHTHLALRAEHGNRLFLNSGSCAEGKTTFLSIDTRASAYAVHTSW
jgi:predicted phosphodiesterase